MKINTNIILSINVHEKMPFLLSQLNNIRQYITEDYYDGNYNDGNYKHMMAIIYKVSIYKSFIHAKRKYIFMIIDNPYYNCDFLLGFCDS